MDEQYTGDVTDVRTISQIDLNTRYNRVWQPYIERWAEGHLITAWGHHLTGKTDMGDIVCSVSRDDGGKWLPPVEIFDHRKDYGGRRYAFANPALYRAPGQGIVWCFAMRCPLHFRDSENSDLCAAYTADGGFSWVDVELTNHFSSPLITCNAPLEVNGRYLLPVHRNTMREDPNGDGRQFILESTDLISWRLAGYVLFDESDPVFLHEASLAGTADGGLAIVMRTATYGHKNYDSLPNERAYRSVSSDGGRTWSAAKPVPEFHNTGCKAHYLVDSKGREVYVYSPGPRRERKALHYVARETGGEWSKPKVFYDGKNHNSYPTLLERPDQPGEYWCVWDSSWDYDKKRTTIRFGKFSLAQNVSS
ncbi:MAG: exo-alpha-sialidase [Spirochaetales bacterium]|jgi:hypothetical protein|nr:exo-alpha-sialidase [Spirochaetales bacterium]